MDVTDEEVATLRAFLAFDPVYERLTRELAESGRQLGFGELAYGAFVTAVQQRFAPNWTSADIIQFTARLRNGLRTRGLDLDPVATETLIRRALGDHADPDPDPVIRARAVLFVLGQLISDAGLDGSGLDAFLGAARLAVEETRPT